MGKKSLASIIMLMGVLLITAMGAIANAASTAAEITGEIERLTLNDATDVYSGGVLIVGGTQVILPKNLLIDLPANRLSLQQIFDQAPAACKTNGESGLARTDKCNSMGSGGFVTLSGVHSSAGNVIAADVLIEKGKETVFGLVSYINYTDGYFRVNGNAGDATTGVMVRLNDPTSRHTIQQGSGCAGGPNCSPDPRFTLDPDNYVIAFSTGYPVCIPSTVSRTFNDVLGLGTSTAQSSGSGSGDVLCPATNRTPGALNEPAVNDSRLFAPLLVGDSVNAEGNYETLNGTRFLSAHTMRVNKALSTKNLATQPDYMFLEEVFIEAPSFQNQRARTLIIGFTTLSPTDVDLWTIHRDPVSNAIHEFPLASVQGCDAAAGAGTCSSQGLVGAGANIFRLRYDVDFLLAATNDPKYPGGATAKLNPCLQLMASPRFTLSNPGICTGGVTLANNFGILSPIPHEIQARTGHSLTNPGLITLDIRGNQATNGQYLFPFGMNLGGIETADFLEVDINLLTTPRTFEGIPWNLDRRLSPSGCLRAGGCEATPQPLDPFPFTGLDPRTQADFQVAGLNGGTPKGTYSDPNFTNSTLTNASNRIFSFVSGTPFLGGKFNFDGNNTLLPCASGLFPASCPPDPGLITINPTPIINIFPPIADEDAAVVNSGPGASVVIDVLANDIPILGTIDPATLQIATFPTNGTVQVNPNHTITYFPSNPFTVGSVSFTYTVANNYGSVSLPGTVTVTIFNTFTITSAAAANGSISPAGTATVLANSNQTYTITPNAGFTVANLIVDGTLLPGATSYTFTNVTADHYINAYFTDQVFTVTASAGANGTITPSGAVSALYGTSSSFTITPNAGFQVGSLVVDGVTLPAATTYGFTSISGNHTISANFVPLYTVLSAAAPNGAVSPAGATTMASGANQTIVITPNAGYTVAALVVDGVQLPGATSYTFSNVTADHYINAYFAEQAFTVTASAGANGTITPAGAVTALYGSSSSFTITPNAGFRIANLVVDGVTLPAATSYGFTSIAGNHTISADFTNSFTLSATSGPNGAISPAGATTLTGGGSQTYTITPDTGFVVAALVVDGVTLPGATSYTFTSVAANHTISASFALPPTITAAAGTNGAISPAGAATVTYGSSQTYTITPNSGFMVIALVVDGVQLPAATSYTFTNVTANHYINAYFGPLPATVTITAAAAPNGAISPAGATVVAGGGNQTFTITPNTGFMVTALVVDGVQLPGATSYTFTNVTADHYINAYFGPVPASVTITAAAGTNGVISPVGATVVSGGTNQTFNITPDNGFVVTALVVDGVQLPGATSYTFTNVTTDHYINAYFGP